MKNVTKIVVGSLITAASSVAFSAAAGYALFNEVMNRNAKIYPAVASRYADKVFINHDDEKKTEERVSWYRSQTPEYFELVNDSNLKLKAQMIPAENDNKIFVFCSHGYRSSGLGEYEVMAKFYHDLGANVFIVDHAAHGSSEGKYIGFGYHECKDCLLWLNFLIDKFGEDIQIILQGISMGSATVLMMSGDENLPEQVKFTVADCGYTSAEAEFEFDIKEYMHLPQFPLLNTANAFNKAFNGFDFEDASPIDSVSKAKVPILFIHGDADNFVPTFMVHQLYASCTSEYKDLLLIKGAGHAESYKVDSDSYEAKVREFFNKFITL